MIGTAREEWETDQSSGMCCYIVTTQATWLAELILKRAIWLVNVCTAWRKFFTEFKIAFRGVFHKNLYEGQNNKQEYSKVRKYKNSKKLKKTINFNPDRKLDLYNDVSVKYLEVHVLLQALGKSFIAHFHRYNHRLLNAVLG